MEAVPLSMIHRDIDAFVSRFGNIAYAPFVSHIPEENPPNLKDLDILILDALLTRRAPRISRCRNCWNC